MSKCDRCASIDAEKLYESLRLENGTLKMDRHRLKDSRSMAASTQLGCDGCRFVLAVIRQECNDAHQMDAFIHRAEEIFICCVGPRENFKIATQWDWNLRQLRSTKIDLCLAADEFNCAFGLCGGDPPTLATHVRPIPKNPLTNDCFDMTLSSLRMCSTAHAHRCVKPANAPLPTCLIDVAGHSEGRPIRVHITRPGERGRYLTLSHCWGSRVKFVTTTSNLIHLQRTIDFQSLSQTFNDAIVITRRLGFRYLWIDALCIVQDSQQDWARESSQMARIYRRGTLMLSAVAAPNGEWGMLRDRKVLRSHHFGSREQFLLQKQANTIARPLDVRAWAYQERIMAPRILHFGQQKITWECASASWAEDTGLADMYSTISWYDKRQAEPFLRYETSSLRSTWLRLVRPLTCTNRTKDIRDRLHAYYDCVEFYSARKLTRSTDKLPAFSGLASAFRVPKLGTYLAGLWEADLVHGLAWKREGHGIHSME